MGELSIRPEQPAQRARVEEGWRRQLRFLG
jgi:hypothetical protein